MRRTLLAAAITGVASLSGAAVMLAGASGCGAASFLGGMASNSDRAGEKTVQAEYTKLTGKSFAVVVAADRSISGEFPDIVPLLTREMTKRIAENSDASAMVPADDILRFQYQRPGWVAMSPRDLAKELEVDRLIFVDLHDYSLTDPGNSYVWNGSATGVVNVLEVENSRTGEFAFKKSIRVKFPDKDGMSPYQIPQAAVATELARRFINRASWAFYQHEEPNALTY
jgi:hypothetical protein